MAIHAKTQEIIDAITQDDGQRIAPVTYTWAFRSRAHVSAAFRIAKDRCIIRVAYTSAAGTPVYERVEEAA